MHGDIRVASRLVIALKLERNYLSEAVKLDAIARNGSQRYFAPTLHSCAGGMTILNYW